MNWTLLQNSLALAACVAAAAVILGAATALWAACVSARAGNGIVAGAALALAMPPFLVANCWMHFFGLNGVWRGVVPFNLYSWPGAWLLMTLLIWPISFFLVSAALNRLEPARLEVDPLLRGGRALRWVILPQIRSALGASAVISFVMALNHFSVPALLQTKVFSADVWVTFNTTFDFAEALRLGWPMIVGPILLLLYVRGNVEVWSGRPQANLKKALGSTFAVVGVVVLAMSVVFPIGHLLLSERTWARLGSAVAAGKSAMMASLIIAVSAATVAAVAGIFLSKRKAGGLLWLAFLVPGVLLGIAFIRVFNQPALNWIYPSFAVVTIAVALRYAALPWMAIREARGALNADLLAAARLDGASGWQRILKVELPMLAGPIFFAWHVAYLFCLWDAETLLMIVPPGGETLALRIFNMLHYGHTDQVNALCVVLLGMAVAPLALRALAARGGARALPVVMLLVVAGCSEAPEGATKLQSKMFSHVEVWGKRGNGVGEFNKPRSVAVDREDNVYVADITGRVQKFSPEGKYLLSWVMPISDKGKPKGMITDPNGGVIVVEPHYARVNHYSADGKVVHQWGITGTNIGELTFPRSVAVNSAGEIFLSEYGLVDRIQRFDARGTNLLSAIVGDGTKPGEFSRAEGVGVDSKDRLFVADSCNHRIQVFERDGKFLREHGNAGSAPGQMSYPYDVRVDRAGFEFVCEFGNSRVQVFDADGYHVEFVGGAGMEPGRMNNPWAICLDSKGNLYVADSQNHRVQKFTRRQPLRAGGDS